MKCNCLHFSDQEAARMLKRFLVCGLLKHHDKQEMSYDNIIVKQKICNIDYIIRTTGRTFLNLNELFPNESFAKSFKCIFCIKAQPLNVSEN